MGDAAKKNDKPQNRNRGPSDKAILERARRMARGETNKLAREFAEALGLEGVDGADVLRSKLGELKEEKRKGMDASTRSQEELREAQSRVKALEAETEKLRAQLNKSERERKREVERRRDLEAEYAVTEAARSAGVAGDSEYAIHLFRQHVRGNGEHANDPKAYFESLKADDSKKFLFGKTEVLAGPSSGKRADAPAGDKGAEGTPPPEEKGKVGDDGQPPPAKPGAKADDYDAMKDDKRSFNERTRAKYGFGPGM